MRKLKYVIVAFVAVVVLAIAVFFIAPSNVKAQGLVEYYLYLSCLGAAADTGVPNPTDPGYQDLISELKSTFGFTVQEDWPPNWGAFGTCLPKFNQSNELTKFELCAVAYQDENSDSYLSWYDTKQMEICYTFKVPKGA